MVRLEDLTDFFRVARSTIYKWCGGLLPKPHYYDGERIPYWNLEEIKAKVPGFTDEALEKLRAFRAIRKAAQKKAKISV